MGLFVAHVVFGIAVAWIAHAKGRNPIPWFFIGAIFTLIGLLIVLVIANPNEQKYFQARQDDENRRLREQLRQERIKHETLREYTMRRLDAHDQVLGVDTRALQALPGENNQNLLSNDNPPQAPAQAAPEPPHSNAWYYEQNGETRGPVPADVIHALLADGQITTHTLLWADHLPDWRPAAVIPEFQHRAT